MAFFFVRRGPERIDVSHQTQRAALISTWSRRCVFSTAQLLLKTPDTHLPNKGWPVQSSDLWSVYSILALSNLTGQCPDNQNRVSRRLAGAFISILICPFLPQSWCLEFLVLASRWMHVSCYLLSFSRSLVFVYVFLSHYMSHSGLNSLSV